MNKMKYLRKFNEAIVDWETDNIKSFYQELNDRLNNLPKLKYSLSFDDVKEVGEKYDIEVVDYQTFLNDLPTEKMKKDAPPRGVPAFGLVNPITHKARLVINVNMIDKRLLDFIYHMLKHENVHVGQKARKKDKNAGEYLGDVTKTKEYFSNKDEVMAFAQSVSDMVMNMNPRNLNDAIKMIERTPLWRPIQTVDEKTKKRYKKYIYLYLEKEFEKKGQKLNSLPQQSNSLKIEIDKNVDVFDIVNDLYDRYKRGTLKYEEFESVSDQIIDSISKLKEDSSVREIVKKMREINRNL